MDLPKPFYIVWQPSHSTGHQQCNFVVHPCIFHTLNAKATNLIEGSKIILKTCSYLFYSYSETSVIDVLFSQNDHEGSTISNGKAKEKVVTDQLGTKDFLVTV